MAGPPARAHPQDACAARADVPADELRLVDRERVIHTDAVAVTGHADGRPGLAVADPAQARTVPRGEPRGDFDDERLVISHTVDLRTP